MELVSIFLSCRFFKRVFLVFLLLGFLGLLCLVVLDDFLDLVQILLHDVDNFLRSHRISITMTMNLPDSESTNVNLNSFKELNWVMPITSPCREDKLIWVSLHIS